MLNTIPEKIEFNEKELSIAWKDGKSCTYDLLNLRKQCPCVHCRGGHDSDSVRTTDNITEAKLAMVKKVGRYALQFRWSDGHDEGIFRLEELRAACDENRAYE